MIIDVHMHPLVKDAEYVPDLTTVIERFFRPQSRACIEREIRAQSLDDVIGDMDAAGVDVGVIVAMDITFALGVIMVTNESVAEMVKRFPKRLIGFASVDPNTGESAVEKLERAVCDMGLRGLKLVSPVQQFAPNDEAFNLLWEKVIELNIPAWFHTGHQISTPGSTARFGHPALIDELAMRYPELTIIMGHCACPWFWEAWSVCCRHKNVHLDVSVYTKLYHYFPWDAFSEYGQEHKLLFATDYPLQDLKSCVEAIERLDISDSFKQKILGENALRILPIGH